MKISKPLNPLGFFFQFDKEILNEKGLSNRHLCDLDNIEASTNLSQCRLFARTVHFSQKSVNSRNALRSQKIQWEILLDQNLNFTRYFTWQDVWLNKKFYSTRDTCRDIQPKNSCRKFSRKNFNGKYS